MRLLVWWSAIAMTMGGCAYYTTPAPIVADEPLTRGQFEASKARSECRAMARNLLQIYRCDGR